MRSADQRLHWKAISPDLTRNDKSKQQPSGGSITLDITSVEYYDTVFALAESPLQAGLLWAGTDLICPPQRAQHSICTPNTRFSRLAQLIATCRGVAAPGPRCAGVTADRC